MLPKGVIATSFVMIYWQLRDTLSSVTQCQDATYSIPNRILTGHAFKNHQTISNYGILRDILQRGSQL